MGRVITVPGRRGFSLPSLNPLPAGFSAVAFPTGVAALRSNQLDLLITYSFSVTSPSSHRSLHVFPPLVLQQTVLLLLIHCCLEQKNSCWDSKIIKITIRNVHTSLGERRAVTPGRLSTPRPVVPPTLVRPVRHGNSMSPKTPQSGFLEEAEAMPAETY